MIGRQPLGDDFQWMHAGQIGAPQMTGLNSSQGDILKVLDGALINGFNLKTPNSVSAQGGTVVFGFDEPHGYELRQKIRISGADEISLNGDHRVVAKTSTTVSINTLGVSVTTGAISMIVAPLGFESIFGAADPMKRAYRSLNPATTRTVLYLDCSLPVGHGYNAGSPVKRAMVSLCANMTTLGVQIGSYTDAENNYTTNPNGSLFWRQRRGQSPTLAVNTATEARWVIVGSGDYFYFFQTWGDYGSTGIVAKRRDIYAFGDVPSFGGIEDDYNCMWVGSYSVNDRSSDFEYVSNGAATTGSLATFTGGYFIRPHNGGSALARFALTPSGTTAGFYTGMSNGVVFPNPASQSLIAVPLYALSQGSLRAVMPRLMAIPQELNKLDNTAFDLIIANNVMTVCVEAMPGRTDNTYGYYAIDLGD